MTPVFAHGHLRLYLLSLLSERSGPTPAGSNASRSLRSDVAAERVGMHGYELIQALGERFGGTYTPSAGTIYPRLAKLEDEGLVTKAADGRKTVYAITDAGRAELADREGELEGIESEVTDTIRRLADEVRTSVNAAMKTLRADLAAAARDARTETTDAKEAGRGVRDDLKNVRVESRGRLQEAEMILSEFRHGLRSDLRNQVVHGELGAQTIDLLRAGLDDVRRSVADSLRGKST